MHIPGHLLDPATCVATSVVSVGAIGYAWHRARNNLSWHKALLVGAVAACVFAAQMLNYPISADASGHVLGGALAAILLGPGAAMVVIGSVLLAQCLLFQDGGVSALGANALNMAVIAPLVGYAVYQSIRRQIPGLPGVCLGACAAAWLSVVAAAAFCAGELAAGGTTGVLATLSTMIMMHSVIGLGEAIASGAVVACLWHLQPAWFKPEQSSPASVSRPMRIAAVGLMVALALAALASPYASALPDGLDASLALLGLDTPSASPLLPAPFADYKVVPLQSSGMAGPAAGILGVLVVFGFVVVSTGRRVPHRSLKFPA